MAQKQANTSGREDLLGSWGEIPQQIETMIDGRSDDELAMLPGSEGLSLRELVHHLVEANIVASTMIIAALGASGCTFDWSWLWPNKEWTERLGYNNAPTAPSIKALENLITHISGLVATSDDALEREVKVFDSPGAETYMLTVGQIIRQEIDHVTQHLGDVRKTSA